MYEHTVSHHCYLRNTHYANPINNDTLKAKITQCTVTMAFGSEICRLPGARWDTPGKHRANPHTPPAGIKTFQEVQRERAWQIWSCLLMSCAFNLLNDLRERRTHGRLLSMTSQINKHSQHFSSLAAGDLLVYAKKKKKKKGDPHPASKHLIKCYLLFIKRTVAHWHNCGALMKPGGD